VKYVVIEHHRSEYPTPITFAGGTLLDIGQRYEGEEPWQDWYLCSCSGQAPGWVPAQVIERIGVDRGRAVEAYCAHELDIDPGQQVERPAATERLAVVPQLAQRRTGLVAPGETALAGQLKDHLICFFPRT
jgi:hypothetical protein